MYRFSLTAVALVLLMITGCEMNEPAEQSTEATTPPQAIPDARSAGKGAEGLGPRIPDLRDWVDLDGEPDEVEPRAIDFGRRYYEWRSL